MTQDWTLIDRTFEQAIECKVFSGAQICFGSGTKNISAKCYGRVTGDANSSPIQTHTLFDVASLTKPLVTTSLAMSAVESGKVRLDDPLVKYLPEFDRPERITIRQCLAHNAGLPDWLPLYREVAGQGWSLEQVREFFLTQLNRTPLVYVPGAQRLYSDLGFILLGFLLEAVAGRSLSALWDEGIARPLQMSRSYFNPLDHGLSPTQIAATEQCPWRKKLLQGEVHDDNCFVLGGVAGHAGLFSTAEDIEKFCHWLLSVWGGAEFLLSLQTLKTFLGPKVFPKLGWDMVTPPNSQAGGLFSKEHSVGHLAFTGCSLWIDFSDGKYLVLLTNRVHPTRDNEAIKLFRPKIHDLVVQGSGEKGL